MGMGFFWVEPSTIMAKIVWSAEGCQRLHSHLAPHGYDFELPSHNWDNDGEAVFTPSCNKYITIENLLFNMTGSERMEASCANDNKDIIMAQLIWSKRGCELVHPGLLRPQVLMGIVGLRAWKTLKLTDDAVCRAIT